MQYPGVRLSEGVEWTVHCCTLLATLPQGVCLPGARLAEFHGVPGPYLVKHLQALTRAGVLDSVPGPKGGFRLARPAGEITVAEVVEAIDGRRPAFTCTEIRRRGPAGGLPARAQSRAASTCSWTAPTPPGGPSWRP